MNSTSKLSLSGIINVNRPGKSISSSQQILPNLQLQSLRQRMTKAAGIYKDNLKLFERLSSTKTTIPTLGELKQRQKSKEQIKKKLL
mmetsp:Transcript_10100/g.15425  ORF Transcript_10100/g.15425 Transcript_10100/m.15425 type:complete len:87 (+) Transcript_10100:3-263(+)